MPFYVERTAYFSTRARAEAYAAQKNTRARKYRWKVKQVAQRGLKWVAYRGNKSVRAKTTVTYHGRTRKPMLHWTQNGRAYVMVRAKRIEGSGTKRLYLDTKKAKEAITEGYTALRKEAHTRRR